MNLEKIVEIVDARAKLIGREIHKSKEPPFGTYVDACSLDVGANSLYVFTKDHIHYVSVIVGETTLYCQPINGVDVINAAFILLLEWNEGIALEGI